MEILIKCQHIPTLTMDINSIKTLNDLCDFNHSLEIEPKEYDKSIFIKVIKEYISKNEVIILQKIIKNEPFDTQNIIDEIQQEVSSYFNTKVNIKIQEDFWGLFTARVFTFVREIGNGCGNKDVNVPDLIFNKACDLHDAMYQITDSELEKKISDDYFLKNMILNAKGNPIYPLFKLAALIYYKGVDLFGKDSTNINH